MSVGPKFHMGDAVALVAGESQVYLGPVKGFPRKTQFGYEYEVAHGRGGRKLFRESELAAW
jgi:hypothetical protein